LWSSVALLLSRAQFGHNTAFHVYFHANAIGPAWILIYFRLRYERTREAWLETCRRWVMVFALTFSVGAVSGITRSLQFGTRCLDS
jgi:cytochrome d ubiquinol oxidase subunit I